MDSRVSLIILILIVGTPYYIKYDHFVFSYSNNSRIQPPWYDFGKVYKNSKVEASAKIVNATIMDFYTPEWIEIYEYDDDWFKFKVNTSIIGELSDEIIVETTKEKVGLPLKIDIRQEPEPIISMLIYETPFDMHSTRDPSVFYPLINIIDKGLVNVSYYLYFPKNLQYYDLILLAEGGLTRLTPMQIQTLKNYVINGGNLFICADSFYRGTIEKANQIIKEFGLKLIDEEFGGDVFVNKITLHPITSGVSMLRMWRPSIIIAEDSFINVKILASPSGVVKNEGVLAVSHTGSGNIIVLGDSLWWSSFLKHGENFDNSKIFLNIFLWISKGAHLSIFILQPYYIQKWYVSLIILLSIIFSLIFLEKIKKHKLSRMPRLRKSSLYIILLIILLFIGMTYSLSKGFFLARYPVARERGETFVNIDWAYHQIWGNKLKVYARFNLYPWPPEPLECNYNVLLLNTRERTTTSIYEKSENICEGWSCENFSRIPYNTTISVLTTQIKDVVTVRDRIDFNIKVDVEEDLLFVYYPLSYYIDRNKIDIIVYAKPVYLFQLRKGSNNISLTIDFIEGDKLNEVLMICQAKLQEGTFNFTRRTGYGYQKLFEFRVFKNMTDNKHKYLIIDNMEYATWILPFSGKILKEEDINIEHGELFVSFPLNGFLSADKIVFVRYAPSDCFVMNINPVTIFLSPPVIISPAIGSMMVYWIFRWYKKKYRARIIR